LAGGFLAAVFFAAVGFDAIRPAMDRMTGFGASPVRRASDAFEAIGSAGGFSGEVLFFSGMSSSLRGKLEF
jgi:hypothetical protein